MAETDANKLVIREYPIWLWLSGLITCLIGVYVLRGKEGMIPGAIAILIGLILALVIAHIVMIDADKNDGSLRIRYVAVLHRENKEFLLSDIAAVDVESSSGSEGGYVYRVVFTLRTGEIAPLYSFYSSGYRSKEKRARRLSEFIGVPGPAPEPANPLQRFGQTLRGPFTLVQEGETAGVHWQVESGGYGASPVTRWSSPDFVFSGGFLLLAQKPEAMTDFPGGGLMKAVTGLLYRPLLAMYGFQAEDTPGLDNAQTVPLDIGLEKTFFAYASDPEAARRQLNPWVGTLLSQWSNQNPLKIVQDATQGQCGQLVVLYSPHKLYVAVFNSLDAQQTEDLIRLGVDLTRQSAVM